MRWPLSGDTTPGKSGPGSDGNEGVLCIPQSSSTAGTSPSDCFVSYPGHSLGGGVLTLCREAVGVFYGPSLLGKCYFVVNDIVGTEESLEFFFFF